MLCTNTMHRADAVDASVGIPLIHIVDCVAAAVSAGGMRWVRLLGTRFTMEDSFWSDRMRGTASSSSFVPETHRFPSSRRPPYTFGAQWTPR